MSPTEQVVLVDDHGNAIGAAPKSTVHTQHTPLHLAFSCYVRRANGEVLVTRRALTKPTWPGVWTNSFCGHPAPGEAFEDAIHRRAGEELGTRVHTVRMVLPSFRYRAIDPAGTVENEICPVFVADLADEVRPVAAEVAEIAWVPPHLLHEAVQRTPFAFSPWLVAQLPPLLSSDVFETEKTG